MANFANLLKKPADEVKRPEAAPDGTYFGTIKNHEFGESSQKKTPYVQYNYVLSHAADGVDTEGVEIPGKKGNVKFYITDDSLFRLIDFIQSFGINTTGRTLEELVPQPTGQSVVIDLVRRPTTAGDAFFNEAKNIKGLASPEAQPQPEAAAPRRRGAAAAA